MSNSINYTYYIHYPRNFSNEYEVFVAGSERAREWCEAQVEENVEQWRETWERITEADAAKLAGIRTDEDRRFLAQDLEDWLDFCDAAEAQWAAA